MKTITRFTHPDVLSQIGVHLLTELFQHFAEDLKERHFPMPYVMSGEEDFFAYLAHVFSFPSDLPLGLVHTVLAIEELASPENKAHLEAAFWASPMELYIAPEASPEKTALTIWLNAPYQLNPDAKSPEESPVRTTPKNPGLSVLAGVEIGIGKVVTKPETGEAASEVPPLIIPPSSTSHQPPSPAPPPIPESAVPPQLVAPKAGEGGSPEADEDHDAEPDEPRPKTAWNRTRNGRVARLRKPVRDRINHLMLDGRTYREIIELLGEDGKTLNEDCLSTWKKGGYLDWRREEMDLSEIRVRQEYAMDIARETEGTSLCEATSKMLVAQLMDGLRHSGPNSLQTALSDKPEIYVRLLNSVARLSSAAISCEQQRLKEDARKASLEKEKLDPTDRSITQETLTNIDQMLRNH